MYSVSTCPRWRVQPVVTFASSLLSLFITWARIIGSTEPPGTVLVDYN
ncbi:MAG: hypothetical protein WDZ59_14600 [Pirellulales bacterium]